MTEIPEHLLKRSQARRAGGDAPAEAGAAASTPASTPATTAAATPAVAAPKAEVVPAGPPAAPPDIPVVAAYKARKKIPVWAMATLSILPVWMFLYLRALTPVTAEATGPLGLGAQIYAGNCSGCHGAGGAGVAGGAYAFTENSSMLTFPHIEDQLRWVSLGTTAYIDAGVTIAGDPNREGGAHIAGSNGIMPARGGNSEYTDADILGAVCDERYALGGAPEEGEEFDLWCSPESPVFAALEAGTATFENVHEVFAEQGVVAIGSVPVAGTSATG